MRGFLKRVEERVNFHELMYSQFSRIFTARGSLLGIPLGYKANKLLVSLSYPVDIIRTLV